MYIFFLCPKTDFGDLIASNRELATWDGQLITAPGGTKRMKKALKDMSNYRKTNVSRSSKENLSPVHTYNDCTSSQNPRNCSYCYNSVAYQAAELQLDLQPLSDLHS